MTESADTEYQCYASSRPSMQLITTKGKRIAFVSSQFITTDRDIIEYLDDEISRGLNLVTKGKPMTADEIDPMSALKKKHIAEYLAKEQEELADRATGKMRDITPAPESGKSAVASATAKLGAASSKATLAVGSTSSV